MPRRGSGAKAALVVLATGTDRTGGAATGLPGNAACNVGFTAGCGTIEHLSTAEFQSRIESEVRKWERNCSVLRDECGNASGADGPIGLPTRRVPSCGSARLLTDLRAVLPPLARCYKVPREVIAEDAADRLSKAGGIGAWLK
jgi:hypothetical protein